jgi:hypothetical protein
VAVLLLPRLRLVVTAVASAGASAYSKPTANMSPRRPDTLRCVTGVAWWYSALASAPCCAVPGARRAREPVETHPGVLGAAGQVYPEAGCPRPRRHIGLVPQISG